MTTLATERPKTQIKWMPLVGARNRRGQMKLLMLIADIAGFGAAAGLVLALNVFLKLFVLDAEDFKYAAVPAFCLVLFLYSQLYPGVGINPAEEIKLVTQYVTTGFVGGWIVLGWSQAGWILNHFGFPIMWVLSIPSILLLRWNVRIAATKLGLWGEPVVVMGGGDGVHRTIRYFLQRRRLGYIPVMAVLDGDVGHALTVPMPVIGRRSLLNSEADRFSGAGIQTLMVDVPALTDFFRSDEAKSLFLLFRRIILVSHVNWLDGASMQVQDFEGMIGIAAQKGVLTPTAAFLKRALDITLGTVIAVVLLPLMIAAALWIKLDSAGPVFYDQDRLAKDRRKAKRPGKHGRKIRIYKFRTMLTNSESALKAYLRTHPEAQAEWDANQKLSDDPRLTRAGRFLRMFSVDEMPQVLNVIKGEMSLVGPRPLPEYHHDLLSENLREMRGTLRPGMTGMWQVSGRSDSGTLGMEMWDAYYIHNWSVWLDIYILLRTVWVVLSREGAY